MRLDIRSSGWWAGLGHILDFIFICIIRSDSNMSFSVEAIESLLCLLKSLFL